MTPPKVWKRRAGTELTVAQNCVSAQYLPITPITPPPTDLETIKSTCDTIHLTSFTASDAWALGHILYARLSPLSSTQPAVISISHANSNQILFQCVTGPGTSPDNQTWVDRKRSTVLRWGCSTWYLGCKYAGDEEVFRKKFGMGEGGGEVGGSGRYAIHGGGVPIRVDGVDGVVGVVVVSGLRQNEDHGVIWDALREGWE